jgi:hypothetical protein
MARLTPTSEVGESLVVSILKQLKDLLCDDWDYCEKRKEYKDDFKFITAATAMAVKTMSVEVGIVVGALLIATYKGPDFFCSCSERENPTPS